MSCSVCVQSYLTVCNPMDCSMPDSSVHGFSRQEYWSRLPFSFKENLPDPGIQFVSPCLLHWQADSLPLSHLESPIPL